MSAGQLLSRLCSLSLPSDKIFLNVDDSSRNAKFAIGGKCFMHTGRHMGNCGEI